MAAKIFVTILRWFTIVFWRKHELELRGNKTVIKTKQA